MVFSSHLFVFYFLPLALGLYYLVPTRARHLTLTLLSYLFYGWASPAFASLLLLSTAIDYVAGLVLSGAHRTRGLPPLLVAGGARTRAQKLALAVSMVSNLALLGFFKYFNFAASSYDGLVSLLGLDGLRLDTAIRVTLPLGISFYTFQSMSYAIDVYRGEARARRSFIDFACFVSMFPQLVAGPIIRFQEVADQLDRRTHTLTKMARGVSFLAVGLAKKVLLANPCGQIADATFGASELGTGEAWYGLVAYAFQIYFDFSGYSDMAIGLGLMLGFVFAKNFDSPYRAESMTEFWRRWHLSLSTWLRDYLYRPLGGNRKGPIRTYVNLVVVMLLGGLWHGASWNFFLWGAMHGAMLVIERARGPRGLYAFLPRPLRIAVTFAIVLLTWVPFRAPDLASTLRYYRSLVGGSAASDAERLVATLAYQPYLVLSLALAALVVWTFPSSWTWTRRLDGARALASAALLAVALVLLTTQSYNPFIYYIF